MLLKDGSSGWNELRPNVMKTIKQIINFPLMCVINLSFETGVFPRRLKIANAAPISKSGEEIVLQLQTYVNTVFILKTMG